jgi:hypothetical protein
MCCALKKDMVAHNERKVQELQEPIAIIKADTHPKSEASRSSVEKDSRLPGSIMMCRGTKFRLTHNLWTAEGLINGAKGEVHSIIYGQGSKPPAVPDAVIGLFENYKGPRWRDDMPETAVPICPVTTSWMSHRRSCKRTMLPMMLGYALSVHKLQGDTVDCVILNAGEREFALGLLLVGATRLDYSLHP